MKGEEERKRIIHFAKGRADRDVGIDPNCFRRGLARREKKEEKKNKEPAVGHGGFGLPDEAKKGELKPCAPDPAHCFSSLSPVSSSPPVLPAPPITGRTLTIGSSRNTSVAAE